MLLTTLSHAGLDLEVVSLRLQLSPSLLPLTWADGGPGPELMSQGLLLSSSPLLLVWAVVSVCRHVVLFRLSSPSEKDGEEWHRLRSGCFHTKYLYKKKKGGGGGEKKGMKKETEL